MFRSAALSMRCFTGMQKFTASAAVSQYTASSAVRTYCDKPASGEADGEEWGMDEADLAFLDELSEWPGDLLNFIPADEQAVLDKEFKK